jgi:sugar O-acyltransferase (sialic acid O-acetyltransferase NeuD family)
MKQLIIIGAGAFAREIFAWAKQTPEYNREWIIKGFLDNRPDILKGYQYEAGVISSVEDYQPQKDDLFAHGLGDPISKKRYGEIILDRGGVFTNIIHPTTAIAQNVKVGRGVVICPHVTLSSDCQVGDFVAINGKSGIGHDVKVGDWTCIQSYCDLTGFARIGKMVTINSHAVILPEVEVGDGAIVGAGSVVVNKVQPGTTVFGMPALPLKF